MLVAQDVRSRDKISCLNCTSCLFNQDGKTYSGFPMIPLSSVSLHEEAWRAVMLFTSWARPFASIEPPEIWISSMFERASLIGCSGSDSLRMWVLKLYSFLSVGSIANMHNTSRPGPSQPWPCVTLNSLRGERTLGFLP